MKARLSSRFLHDLEPCVELDRPLENPQHAQVLVRYFTQCLQSGAQPDPRVLGYFIAALRRAEKSGMLARELGLTRPRRGNPGVRSAKREKRRLSPDDQIEIAQRLESAPARRGALALQIKTIAAEYRVSPRHIERLLAGHRKEQAEIARMRGREPSN